MATDAEMFPTLTDVEMDRLRRLGTSRSFAEGERLFSAGDRDYSFFAIESGDVRIVEESSGAPRDVCLHRPGTFTGDVSMFTGRPSIVSAVADGDCRALEVTADKFREMLGELPELSDKLMRAFRVRRKRLEESQFMGVRVVGGANCKAALRLREFFYKNNVPHTFQDIEEDAGREALSGWGAAADETPIIACGANVVRRPALAKVAECLGISRTIEDRLFDLVVVGAGPAGLAAAVYGASEGLDTLLLDEVGPGGQAGQSSKIENYMGFPAGLSGTELADRGYLQAVKFGASFSAPIGVREMTVEEDGAHLLHLCTGQRVRTKTALIATGAAYQRLPVDGCDRLEGAGVYYSATSVEARQCRDATAVVVGGGNSAGQAAMFLSGQSREVKLLLRGDDLGKSMSNYLTKRIERAENVEVLFHTEVEALTGDGRLERLTLRNNQTEETSTVDCSALFIFVGAKPRADWVPDDVARDDHGFLMTGPSIQNCDRWKEDRVPCELETTRPGLFAAGDVRSGTTKRCAFAAGDGALAVTCVHQYLSRGE
ncbi:FAD-dependent oxidoreductase [Alienimonas chondri]|uniref:Ferredoxin--NADP reductase n=1 Tax=Alienimonas chondri TaxID=2681879 RepID=A0ABX1V825_9PLAN|nr:cyclic nucleotide-binding domain-containing thioredoxin-disulfide reductase [Alienimonas chondri]NNJ24314.1 Ferredoxin--NADP reductase [Alienimonas chondri]